MSDLAPPKRRWLRFRLRTLMLLCTVLAVVAAWHRHQYERRERAIAGITLSGGNVIYEYQHLLRLAPNRSFPRQWLGYKLGLVDPHGAFVKGKQIDNAFLRQHVLPLRGLTDLTLVDVSVSNEGLRP